MKSLRLFFLLFSMATLAPAPAHAADPNDEIIYRTNLGRADDVRLLLKQGAQVGETDDHGVPLLALAAQRTDAEGLNVLKALVENGADINVKDDDGQTALFYAARVGNAKAVSYLLSRGIDYYATDHHGDIARTIAFHAGHKDIVALLDDFVKAQTAKTTEAYKQYNQTLEERYKQEQAAALAAQKATQETQQAAATPAPRPVEPQPLPPKVAPAPTPEDAAAKEEKMKKLQAEMLQRAADIRQAVTDLSFSNCAFEYWYFCKSARQSTELSDDDLIAALESDKNHIIELEAKLIKEYHEDESFVRSVSNTAKQSIFMQLQDLHSNSNRHEKGIGKKSDMQKRCTDISKVWDIRGIAMPEPEEDLVGGGGIGPVPHSSATGSTASPTPAGNGSSAAGSPAPANGSPASGGISHRKFTTQHPRSLPKL